MDCPHALECCTVDIAPLEEPSPGNGIVDWRASTNSVRQGVRCMAHRTPPGQTHRSPWVVLADISGSMEQGTRMMLHFIHAFARAQKGSTWRFLPFGAAHAHHAPARHARCGCRTGMAISRAVPDWGGGYAHRPGVGGIQSPLVAPRVGTTARVF